MLFDRVADKRGLDGYWNLPAQIFELCSNNIGLSLVIKWKNNANRQGYPTLNLIFGKYLFGRRFEIENFRNICCKISCLLSCPRIFEHLKNGIIAHF